MAETKITKAMVLNTIIERCGDDETIVAYCENELALLAGKKEKAAARAAAKKEAGDELRAVIETILTNATEPMTREDILECIENADELELTPAKVGARVSQLVQLNKAHKVTVKNGDKNKIAYLIGAAEDAE